MTTTAQRIGKPIRTFSGKWIYPLDPRLDEIDLGDIAHALSNLCRFTGHCQFYSVAEHSCYVAATVTDPRLRLPALLHDAAEAYLGDIAAPNKGALFFWHTPPPGSNLNTCESFKEHEERLLRAIFQRLNVPWPDDRDWETIAKADHEMCDLERKLLWARSPMLGATPAAAKTCFLCDFGRYGGRI